MLRLSNPDALEQHILRESQIIENCISAILKSKCCKIHGVCKLPC